MDGLDALGQNPGTTRACLHTRTTNIAFAGSWTSYLHALASVRVAFSHRLNHHDDGHDPQYVSVSAREFRRVQLHGTPTERVSFLPVYTGVGPAFFESA